MMRMLTAYFKVLTGMTQNAARRWEIAQSLVEFRLCLLHNIVKRKRDAAMGIVKGAIQQLKELALSTRDVSHKLLLIWVQILTLIPLIGYVLMSNELKDDFLQLIVEVLDSFIGKTIVEESEEDLVAESFAGESLVDRLIALFSVIWRSEVPQWLPAIPKLPFWDVSSKMVPMTEFIDSKTLAGVVCVRLKRAIGGPSARQAWRCERVENFSEWSVYAQRKIENQREGRILATRDSAGAREVILRGRTSVPNQTRII